MHDGAVIIHGGKIVAARCVLPVTDRDNIPAHLGLRHRSAIGLSELTNTLVVVVSEETGHISIAKDGENIFQVEAKIIRTEPELRPNMRGVSKVEIGERKTIWMSRLNGG